MENLRFECEFKRVGHHAANAESLQLTQRCSDDDDDDEPEPAVNPDH